MTTDAPIAWDTTRHAEQVAAAEARVVDWVWARNASWHALEPFHDERAGKRSNPRRLRKPPEFKADAQLYGFDTRGRMVVSREFGDGFGNDEIVSHEWLRLDACQFEYVTLGARGQYRQFLTEQRVAAYEDGQLVAVDRWSFVPSDQTYYHGRETYHHKNGLLVLIVIHTNPKQELRLTYTNAGDLLAIVADNDMVAYRRPTPRGVARARKRLRVELPSRIATWARRVSPDEPVAFVAVHYGETFSQVLPLTLVLATRREVQAGNTWYPSEYERYDDAPAELEDLNDFDELSEVLNQEWRSTQDENDARAFVRAIADAVQELPFPVVALGPNMLDLDLDVDPEVQRQILGGL